MNIQKISSSLLAPELIFTAVRSSGPGGQNVNKVNSKITLRFDLLRSSILSADIKEFLQKKLESKLTSDGILILSSQEKRSQLQNKEAVLLKLDALLTQAFAVKKPRKVSRPTKASLARRKVSKKKHSEKKQWRRNGLH